MIPLSIPVEQIEYRIRIRWLVRNDRHIKGYAIFRAESARGRDIQLLNPGKLFKYSNIDVTKKTGYIFYGLDVVPGKIYYHRICSVTKKGDYKWVIGIKEGSRRQSESDQAR